MRSLLSPLPVAVFRDDQVVYIAENEQDAEFLATQLDCQVVFPPRHEQGSPLAIEAFRRLEAQTSETSRTPETSQTFECLKRFERQNVSDVSL